MIVVISGKMGSGKTTLAEQLKQLNPNHTVIKFAGPLYEAVGAAWNVLSRYGARYRSKDGPFLQWLGKHMRDTEDINFWCNIARQEALAFEATGTPSDPALVLIDDCRFMNEFDALPSTALKIRLECDRDIRKSRSGSHWRPDEFHESEIGLDEYANAGKFDFYIDTGKVGIDDAFRAVKTMMAEWEKYGRLPHKGDFNNLCGRVSTR